jgi:Domain of unknown function (DUF4365)
MMGPTDRQARGLVPVDPVTVTKCMEQLQEGYVASVAATAGCLFQPITRDSYGFDVLLVRKRSSSLEEISVYAQLKSTTIGPPDPSKEHFSYQLKKREYMERLAAPRQGIRAILIVMAVHNMQTNWSSGSHDHLKLFHCCYWVCLEGRNVSDAAQPTVHIPTRNIFNADELTWILDTLDQGGDLRAPARGPQPTVAP